VYGFPTDFVDCSTGLCPSDVKRLLIKAFEWRSLALTQNPVNQALTGYAHVVSAKAWFEPVVKSMSVTTSPVMNAGLYPNDMDRLIALGKCDQCGVHKYPSSPAYKAHFAKCHGIPEGMANIYGHAIMHAIHKAENMAGLLGIGM
jgi:hypothetical protein